MDPGQRLCANQVLSVCLVHPCRNKTFESPRQRTRTELLVQVPDVLKQQFFETRGRVLEGRGNRRPAGPPVYWKGVSP
jgi:hypothetical protein